jgi:hypothetical protein
MRMMQEKQLISEEFRTVFAKETGTSHWPLDAQDALVWEQHGWLHMLTLTFHAWPSAEMPACPKIIGIRIRSEAGLPEPEARERIGCHSDLAAHEGYIQSTENQATALQWYVSSDELLDFSAWLVLWIRLKAGELSRIPPPPHAIYIWECGLRESTHAWTVSAYHAYHAWMGRDPLDISNALRISPPPWSILPCGTEERAWGAFMTTWWKTLGRQWVTAGQLRDLAIRGGHLAHVLGDGGTVSQSVRLGRALGKMLLRPFGALHAKARRDSRSKARLYALESR